MTKLKIGSPFGIPLYLHWTFILLLFYGIYLIISQNLGFEKILWTTIFSITLFVCVVFHELGHALTAKKYQIITKDIILSPLGGVARLLSLPQKPIQELWVSAAGPLVNLAIFFLMLPFYFFFNPATRNELQGFLNSNSNVFLIQSTEFHIYFFGVMMLNLILAIFNLIPAFPMDGGRILRAILSIRMGRFNATRIASYIGQVFAMLIILLGVYNGSIVSAFIGIFIFQSARREKILSKMEYKAEKTKIRDVYFKNYPPVFINPEWNANLEMENLPEYFPVYDQWMNVLGISSKLNWKKNNKINIEQKIQNYLLPTDNLKDASIKIMELNLPCLPIFEQGTVINVLTLKEIDQILIS